MTTRNTYPPDSPNIILDSPSPKPTLFIPALTRAPETPIGESYEPHRDSWLASTLSRCRDFVDKNTGLLLVASSQLFGALQNVAVKTLNSLDDPVPTLELVVVRMTITYICCISYMHLTNVPDPFLGPKGVRLLLILRGFSGFFGLFGVYYSLNYLSLSDATVLTFLSPLTTAAAGALILKEKFTLREALAGVFCFMGVLLIARPRFLFNNVPEVPDAGHVVEGGHGDPSEKGTAAERLGAVGVALLGVLGSTGAYTSIRAIGKRAHAMHSMVSFSAYCIVAASIGLFIQGTHLVIPTRIEWIALLLLIGFTGFVGQILMTNGLQRETAGRSTMAVYIQIVYAIAFERIFWHTTPSGLSILGTVIIMTSAIYVAITKENENTTKQVRPGTGQVRLQNMSEMTLEEGLLLRNGEEEMNVSEGITEKDSQSEKVGKDEVQIEIVDVDERKTRSYD